MRPKVAVVILNYNGLADTVECLDSMLCVTYPNYGVVLVDNNSDNDKDVRLLQDKYGGYIHIVRCSRNKGFGGGNNRGIRYALGRIRAEYLLLINNDTIVAPDFIEGLVNTIESNHKAGAAVAKICMYDDRRKIEAAGNHIAIWRGQNYRLNWRCVDNGRYDKVKELNSASINGFMVSSKVVWDVGLFDEDFFIYMDDADYCARITKKGYRILYAPMAKIWHKVGATTRRVTGLPQYYLARNNFRFMQKNATRRQYWVFMAYFFTCHLWLMMAVYLVYFRSVKVVRSYIIGVVDGLLGVTGEAKL